MSPNESTERDHMNHSYATHQDIQVLENKFSLALTDGFNKLEQAINGRTDKIENRISAIDRQRSQEISELREKQSSSGKFNPALTVSLVSLVWAILTGILIVFGSVMISAAENHTAIEQRDSWVVSTNEWMSQNDKRDNNQDIHIAQLNSNDTNLILRLSALTEDIHKLEEWYDLNGQDMLSDISTVQERVRYFQETVGSEIVEIGQRLRDIESSRNTVAEGNERDKVISDLLQRIAKLESLIDSE